MRLVRSWAVPASFALASCVSYRPAPLDLTVASTAPVRPPSSMTYAEAVAFAVANNPDLRALRARAAAINPDPGPEPLELSVGVDSDHRPEAELALDALSLLGIGPRAAERALARARASEAWLRHHERAREIAGEIAEAVETERALAGLSLPAVALDVDAYVRAGLEPAAANTAAKSTTSSLEAERVSVDAARRRAQRRLARLLGAPADALLTVTSPPAPWPPVVAADGNALVAARADLQRRFAQYETADAELRRAIAAQMPGITLVPGVASDPVVFFGHVGIRLPVGAPKEARAAECAREAVRHEVEGAVLDALSEAAIARDDAVAAGRRLGAARDALAGAQGLFESSKARLQTTGGSVLEPVLAAQSVVAAARDLREALVEDAEARVRAARAAGWPSATASAACAAAAPGAPR